MGDRDGRRLGHHPADVLPADREQLVGAHRAHVDRGGFLPPEHPLVEREHRRLVDRQQFVPAKPAGCIRGRAFGGAWHGPPEQGDDGALRVGDGGEPPDIGDVHRRAAHAAAQRLGERGGGVHVLDPDIAGPAGRDALGAEVVRQGHHAGDLAVRCREQGVGRAGDFGDLRGPAGDVAVEGARGGGVGGHQLVPDEAAIG